MPGKVQGTELARILRSRHPDLRVVLVSELSLRHPNRRTARCGVAASKFQSKPFTEDECLEAIGGLYRGLRANVPVGLSPI